MTLRRKIVDFVGTDLLNQADQVGCVGDVAMVQEKANSRLMGIPIQMVDSRGIEKGCSPFYAMDDISLFEQELGQVRAILAGHSSDQCSFVHQTSRRSV